VASSCACRDEPSGSCAMELVSLSLTRYVFVSTLLGVDVLHVLCYVVKRIVNFYYY
jgi:hypothetical protein